MAVYFVQCSESKLIKIGSSHNFKGRLCSLQTSSPAELAVLRITEGGRDLESELHGRFADDRSRGEWFRPSPELFAEIERLPQIAADHDDMQLQSKHKPSVRPGGRPKGRLTVSKKLLASLESLQALEPDFDDPSGPPRGFPQQGGRKVSKKPLASLEGPPHLEPDFDDPAGPPRGVPQEKPSCVQPHRAQLIAEAILGSNESYALIAAAHGTSVPNVCKMAFRLRIQGFHIPPRIQGRRLPEDHKLEVMKAVADTDDRYEIIAYQCNVSAKYVCSIARWLQKQGVDIPLRKAKDASSRRQSVERDIIETTASFTAIATKHGYANSTRVGEIAAELQEQGIAFAERPKGRPSSSRREAIERDIIETTASFAALATKYKVTDGYIGAIAKRLRDQGISFVTRLPGVNRQPRITTNHYAASSESPCQRRLFE